MAEPLDELKVAVGRLQADTAAAQTAVNGLTTALQNVGQETNQIQQTMADPSKATPEWMASVTRRVRQPFCCTSASST